MTLYTLNNVSQCYNERVVLDIDRLDIEPGYIHALLGPNGAGKTTLLDILAFLVPPKSGEILFRGRPVSHPGRSLESLRRQVVLVDQHPIMFSTSVRSNIEYGLKLRKIDKARRRRAVDRVLETVGLTRYRSAPAHKLSGGETRRLALARALALEPGVLLCDEPTASVDSENQEIIGTLLRRINEALDTTIIFATHDRVQAATLAHRTLFLENGRPGAAPHENSFSATLTPAADGMLHCRLNDKVKFELPAGRPFSGTHESVRIHIDPEKITFRRPGHPAASGLEVSGTVILTMAEGDRVRMVVNAGVLLVVLMDRARYDKERPSVGETVLLKVDIDFISKLHYKDRQPDPRKNKQERISP